MLGCAGGKCGAFQGCHLVGAEIWATAAVGVALAGLILSVNRNLRSDMAELRRDVGDVRERIARLEGMFEGFTGRGAETP